MSEKRRLLLFDDDEATADIMLDFLEEEFEVIWVSNKEELENNIERDYFSVILVDVSIKGSAKSGYEIIDDLRRKYRITTTPIVVYSAVRNVEEIRKKMGRIFYSYVPKIGRDWQDILLKDCLKACMENGRDTASTVFETYFAQLGVLDSQIESSEVPASFASVLGEEQKITVKTIIGLLRDKQLDGDSWEILESTLWKKYGRFSEQSIVRR
jgi:CheY-like chemotaxis protein